MMAATIYDPETDSFVSVTSARGKVLAAQLAKPKTLYAAPAGGTDSQNAARLAADEAAKKAALNQPFVNDRIAAAAKEADAKALADAQAAANAAAIQSEWLASKQNQNKQLSQDSATDLGLNTGTTTAPTPKTVKSKTPKYDATGKLTGYDVVYSDGTTGFEPGPSGEVKKFTWKNPTTGQVESFNTESEMNAAVETWKVQAGQEYTNYTAETDAANRRAEAFASRTSAFDLLKDQFDQWGLGDLVEPIRALIQDENVSPSEYAIRLRQTAPYLKRFAANAERVKNGLAAINEATYLGLEDQYQNIMRNYGLPESYYARGQYGVQEGFQKFIANDVSAVELEDRIMSAQNRVLKSNPEVLAALKNFYPDITNGDILAYTLDPKNALDTIKRKVTAAEIGGAAIQAGLTTGMTRAEELGAAGITKQQAQQGFQTVAEVAPRGGQLAAMYGESPYTQQTAEQEVFGLAGSVDAAKQRKKLVGLERASFSGQTGTAQGALGRERAGNF